MDAILKFKEAAAQLQQDEIYKAFIEAKQANDKDEQLQGEIGEFNLARLELQNEMGKEDQDADKVAALNEKVNGLYNRVMNSEGMVRYNQAKQGIESFMEHVNAILNAAIAGEDPMAVEQPEAGGCGGGCDSCSGCH